ncbi:MAG TPA: cellulase family glycosylhydrolase [Acidimicrobiales bacterium]|nr:cellulase family glycosylhydrolase [Acidimicrobiales bacterium]
MFVPSLTRSRRAAWAVLVALAVMAASLVGGSAGAKAEVDNTRIGSRAGFAASWQMLWMSDGELYAELDGMARTGARWLRLDFDWPSVQPTYDSWNWQATDRVVKAASDRGMSILGTLAWTPAWARGSSTDSKYPPSDPNTYARFARAAAARFKWMGVRHWEIWNEPNQAMWWKPKPNAWAYTDLLWRANAAIKAADPDATVIAGGLAPAPDASDGSQINGATFVRQMYWAGAKGNFDALAMHPYNYPVEPMYPHPLNAFSSTTPVIHQIMADNGDGWKKVWLTEYGAPTSGYNAVNEDQQADYLVKAYDHVVRSWPWAGPLFYYMYRDQSWDANDRDDNFGLLRRDWSWKKGMWAFRDEMAKPLP